MRRAGIVLCGGRSSRMGRPKAWLPWFGRTMVEHVVSCLRHAVDEVFVVTSKELSLPPLDVSVVEDREPDRGPLAGIRDGLEASRSDLAFVTSTDAPFLTSEYASQMLDRGRPVAPRAGGHVQVLSAVYPGPAWKDAAVLLEQGIARPLRLLERVGFEALDFDERASPTDSESGGGSIGFVPGFEPWRGFNTADQYLSAARELRPDAVAEVELLGRAALGAKDRRFRVPIGTLGAVLESLPIRDSSRFVAEGRVSESFLVSLGGRALVRDLSLPIGPGERVSIFDALAGG